MRNDEMHHESWDHWTRHTEQVLSALGGEGWVAFSVRVPSRAQVREQAREARRGWKRVLAAPPAPAPVPEVYLQARVMQGLLAVECIADTEFEGLSTLTGAQHDTLTTFGWEQVPGEVDLSATFALNEVRDAAELLSASLRGPLGAGSPADVQTRHG